MQALFVVGLETEDVVKQHHSSVVDDLLVAAHERLSAEIDHIGAFIETLHQSLSFLCLEDVCQELEAREVIVLDHLCLFVLQILG